MCLLMQYQTIDNALPDPELRMVAPAESKLVLDSRPATDTQSTPSRDAVGSVVLQDTVGEFPHGNDCRLCLLHNMYKYLFDGCDVMDVKVKA